MNNETTLIENEVLVCEGVVAKRQTNEEYYKLTNFNEDENAILNLFLEVKGDNQESKKDAKNVLNSLKKEVLSFGIYFNNAFAGSVSFTQINEKTPEIEVEIIENYRRKGLAYQSIKKLTRYIVSKIPSIKYFIYRVRYDNDASLNLIKKLGGEAVTTDELLDKIIKTYHLYIV